MTMYRQITKRRGQAMVLYALLIPMLFLFVGAGIDLGWYFINVSRLQNAADAAVIAGAQALADDLNANASSTTSTSTSTSTSGNTTTTTNTTTTITETYSYNSLVDKYPDNLSDKSTEPGDTVAREYIIKNLGVETGTDTKIIVDNWSKGGNPEVTPTYSLYESDDKFYYVVRLTESIEHLFMPGWFPNMEAPVVAVALISKGSSSKTFIEELKELLEQFKNKNVIVGNWEVQKYYIDHQNTLSTSNENGTSINNEWISKDGKYKYSNKTKQWFIKDSNGDWIESKAITEYYARFNYDLYTGAWNHFQDFYSHYTLGDLYRKQTVTVLDDVVSNKSNTADMAENNKENVLLSEYGKTSSVAATSASVNNDPTSLAYNTVSSSTRKTNKDGITESDNVGLPYTADRLDSINIDFRTEVNLKNSPGETWYLQDWDLTLNNYKNYNDVYKDVSFNSNKRWETSGSDANKIGNSYIQRLRIHMSINFDKPYPARDDSYCDKDAQGNPLPDVLWARIESEPILKYPDQFNGYAGKVNGGELNTVSQIIINANSSNYDTTKRPVIVFYDGPETYDSIDASYKAKPDIEKEPDNLNAVLHRKSKPVILNFKEAFRGIFYLPNSPVVVIGDKKDKFKGFVVAKKYMRLKDDSDFEDSGKVRYFNKPSRQYEYDRKIDSDGNVYFQDVGGTNVSSQVKKDTDAYCLKIYYAKDDPETDPAKKKRYYKVYSKDSTPPEFTEFEVTVDSKKYTYFKDSNGMKYIKPIEENGIDIYVDDYGEIQFKDLSAPPTNCGTYDTFGRTDFTTHDYQVAENSEENMLLSGN